MPTRRALYKKMAISLNPKRHTINAKKLIGLVECKPFKLPDVKPVLNQIYIEYDVIVYFN